MSNTTGSYNTATGTFALGGNTTGFSNAALGASALSDNTTGSYNTAGGASALENNITGSNNTAHGYQALLTNTSGTENTAVGSSALSANTTGIGNDAFGAGALRFNTTGLINTALGSYALGNSTTGSSNVAVGRNALFNNTTGSSNTALGYQAGSLCTTGSNNTAIGSFTDLLPNLTYATVLGSGAQASVSNAVILGGTGASAVSVGIGTTAPTLAGLQVERMMGNTSGLFRGSTTSQGVALVSDWPGIYFNSYYNGGQRAMASNGFPAIINSDQGEGGIFFSTTNVANTVQGGLVTMPERMRIRGNGNVGIGTFFPLYLLEVNGSAAKPGGGTWTASSDVRLKRDVTPYTDGLAQVMAIRPVRYRYNEASGHDTIPQYVGVIAQELENVAPEMVGRFEKNGTEYLNVDNSAMIYMLVNAVKEQQVLIEELRERLAAMGSSTGQAVGAASGK
ncbi:MAG: tail fiber domain-containing protein [Flavobacteriales bacterium]|nr:tail fiber domain-containing protein [Flavobacteriales bacterium]